MTRDVTTTRISIRHHTQSMTIIYNRNHDDSFQYLDILMQCALIVMYECCISCLKLNNYMTQFSLTLPSITVKYLHDKLLYIFIYV